MTWKIADFKKLAIQSIPTDLRVIPNVPFVRVLMEPLNRIFAATLYKMQHNSSVIYLEKMLNEYFEVAGYDHQNHEATKTVYISDAPYVPKKYLYQPEENHPMYLGTVYLGNTGNTTYQFIVNIPTAYEFEEVTLRALINYYKMIGKKYIIQTYDL